MKTTTKRNRRQNFRRVLEAYRHSVGRIEGIFLGRDNAGSPVKMVAGGTRPTARDMEQFGRVFEMWVQEAAQGRGGYPCKLILLFEKPPEGGEPQHCELEFLNIAEAAEKHPDVPLSRWLMNLLERHIDCIEAD